MTQATLLDEVDAPAKPKTARAAKNAMTTVTRSAPPATAIQGPGNLLAAFAAAAADPACQPEKMRAMFDMYKEIKAEEDRNAFNAAFVALQRDLPSINPEGKIVIQKKDAQGNRTGAVQQATPYATFNNIMRIVKPLLDKHHMGLMFSTEPSATGDRILVKGILFHETGHERATVFPLPSETSGSKNIVQGWGSSMSYGKRYCTIALLNIISEAKADQDRDGGTEGDRVPSMIDAKQVKEIRGLMKERNISDEKFCERFRVDKVEELLIGQFAEALDALRRVPPVNQGGKS